MPPAKKRAVETPSGSRESVTTAAKSPALHPKQRTKIMAVMHVVEEADQVLPPEFELDGEEYDEDEDLLNLRIPAKPKDMCTDPNGHRVIIHDIVVDNFKSYKDKHQLGPFHKNLTMIIGPNGSGKSNIIDALLFVFGFKNKKIRTNKLTSLIHASSDCNYCQVEIQFQIIKDISDSKYVVLKDASFSISRLVRKDGFMQYKFNDIPTKQEDIAALLKGMGIDLQHNRFLILQGEVEAIALMKPTTKSKSDPGMLEYIEDIIGTHRFVAPIAKLQHRVKLLEIVSSRHLVTKRRNEKLIEQFRPPMVVSVEYLNMSNECLYLGGLLRKGSIARHQIIKSRTQDQMDAAQEEVTELDEHRKVVADEMRKVEMRENKLVANLIKAKEDLEAKVVLFEKEKMEDIRQKEAVKDATRLLVKLTQEEEDAEKDLEKAKNAPEESRKQIIGMQQEIEELQRVKLHSGKLAADNLVKFEARAKAEKAKRDDAASSFAKLSSETNDAQTELIVAEAEQKEMRVTAKQDMKRVSDLKDALTENLAEIEKNKEELAQKEREANEVKRNLQDANNALPALINADRDIRQRMLSLKGDLDETKHENSHLSTKSAVSRKLKEAEANGDISVYYGRVGDLARIDKKYDPAISTNFANLDWHVVETAADAKAAVDTFHKYNLPRSTVFSMDLLVGSDMRGIDSAPHIFPCERLFDKVQCEPRFRQLFYYMIRDTLVVNKLADATRIYQRSKGRYRIVCYDGTLMERNGNISGGGSPFTGRMRTGNMPIPGGKVCSEQDVVKKQTLLDKLRRDHKKIDQQIIECKQSIGNCTTLLSNLNGKIRELNHNIPRQMQAAEALQKAIKEKEEEASNRSIVEVTPEDMEKKKAFVERLRQKLEGMRNATADSKKLLDGFQQKSDTMFQKMVAVHREKAKKADMEITRLETQILKEEASIINAPQAVEAVIRRVTEIRKQIEEKSRDAVVNGRAEIRTETKVSEDNEAELKNRRDDIDVINKKIEEVLMKKAEVCCRMSEITDRLYPLQDNIENYTHMLDECDRKLETDTAALEDLKDKFDFPETFDPHTKLVRFGDPDNEAMIEEGDAVGVPPEVFELFVDWKKRFDELPYEEMTESEYNRYKDRFMELSNSVENFKRKFDEKGISQYSMLMAMIKSDESDTEQNNKAVAEHRAKLAELRSLRLKEFNDALLFLGQTTQMLYQMITSGGDASLKFVEEASSSDPFEAGIRFSVRPATKSWKLIENLSGGEKTLASLCFVFAIHHYRSTPLYVMDEIDAALDLNNVGLIANYIKLSEKTKNSQFIIISLRNQMFEVGSRLVGIYKVGGCTHNVVVDPDRVQNENRKPQQSIIAKMQEEEKKRKETSDATRENLAIEQGRPTAVAPKRRRKLGKLCLADFGLVDTDKDDEPVARGQQMNLFEMEQNQQFEYGEEAGQGEGEEEEEEEEITESEEEMPIKKRRVRVVESDAEEEFEESSPSPDLEPEPEPPRGRRSSRANRN